MLYELLLYQNSHIDFNSVLQRKLKRVFQAESKKRREYFALKKRTFSLEHTNLELILESYPLTTGFFVVVF